MITILPAGGRLSSKMRRYIARGNLITRNRLEEHIRQSEIKALENIIDKAFGVETEPRKVLTLKRKPENDSANVIAGLITQVKDSEEPQEPTPSFDNCYLPNVHLYSVNGKNSKNITVRV
ncbi:MULTISPECIES: transcriptional antitermination N peptide [unclassified Photorhabdus]|uniref:transcriptional antitermination N peptide n=1 Tax=unclassified Photorhabdus TaxID=2620880 RepID=UPI000DCDFB1F|nr:MULTISPECIES: hypothetical protein [unclassified Photorhabdus]RAW92444.1 hypothetical protein CKY03_23210 [Photorhabdus sp. S9-53]RAW92497.1 hypothetical protein CKY05_23060 [Photorhabdus sp. S10-54]RAW96196.1 hypothetical protein CKY04_23065 [Photorhabdus sp. S8-52]